MSTALIMSAGCGLPRLGLPSPATTSPADASGPGRIYHAAVDPQLLTGPPLIRQQRLREIVSLGFTGILVEAQRADGSLVLTFGQAEAEATVSLVRSARAEGLEFWIYVEPFRALSSDDPGRLTMIPNPNGDGVIPADPPRRNPVRLDNQRDAIALIVELTELWEPNGLLLGAVGFGDSFGDIGPDGRRDFQGFRRASVERWPEDILGTADRSFPVGPRNRGPLWDDWQQWRAVVLRDFLANLSAAVRGTFLTPPRLVAVVEGPFAAHQVEGLNWAAPLAPVTIEYPWLPPRIGESSALVVLDGVALGLWEPELVTPTQAREAGFGPWASVLDTVRLGRMFIPPDRERWFLWESCRPVPAFLREENLILIPCEPSRGE